MRQDKALSSTSPQALSFPRPARLGKIALPPESGEQRERKSGDSLGPQEAEAPRLPAQLIAQTNLIGPTI